jgi:uncharacterized protein DUF4031
MPVYVDAAIYPFGRMIMCHMLADSLEELHAMADKIGIQRKWFQDKGVPHYDICKSKRAAAIVNGAVEIDRNQVAAMIMSWRKKSTEAVPK